MSKRISTLVVLVGLGVGLAACGQRPGERALSGGLIGAGSGAAISAISGGNLGTGALVGGGIGAIGGAVTAPRGARRY